MNTRIAKTLFALVAALALAIPASAVAQDNSGLDQYGESPPTIDGGDPGTDAGAGTDTATGTDTGTAGTGETLGTGTAATGGDNIVGPSELGPNRPGELPRTGSETAILAVLGALMIGSGFLLYRRALPR